MKKSFEDAKEKHSEELKPVTLEKDEAQTKIKEMEMKLVQVQMESLRSFEKAYGVCLGRFSDSGVEVEKHTFAAYLSDLQAKMGNGGSGSPTVSLMITFSF